MKEDGWLDGSKEEQEGGRDGRREGGRMPSITTKRKNQECMANVGHPRFSLFLRVIVIFIVPSFNTLSMPQMIEKIQSLSEINNTERNIQRITCWVLLQRESAHLPRGERRSGRAWLRLRPAHIAQLLPCLLGFH